ncbi:VOC family protein [Kribbella lupini]|uniref:VOC family protein n=1 Tax=Kribbella lupini TaxID=291602 RepID=A0ABN2A576_9ACTN
MTVDDVFPILTSAGLPRLLPFYTDVLGGELVYQFPPEGAPAYVSVQFGKASVGLGHDPDFRRTPGRPPIALWLYTDDLDGLVAAIRSAGGRITQEPADQPWGEREARAEDPDGNQLYLGQRAG